MADIKDLAHVFDRATGLQAWKLIVGRNGRDATMVLYFQNKVLCMAAATIDGAVAKAFQAIEQEAVRQPTPGEVDVEHDT
jgi:hypothetical protein